MSRDRSSSISRLSSRSRTPVRSNTRDRVPITSPGRQEPSPARPEYTPSDEPVDDKGAQAHEFQPSVNMENDEWASWSWQSSMRWKEECKAELKKEDAWGPSSWKLSVPAREEQPSPRGQAVRRLHGDPRLPTEEQMERARKSLEKDRAVWENNRKKYREEVVITKVKLYTIGIMEKRVKADKWDLKKYCDGRCDCLVDATVFTNKYSWLGRGSCSGEHPAIMREILKDEDNMNATLLNAADYLSEQIQLREMHNRHDPIHFVVYCEEGKHMSRALARMLHFIFSCLDVVWVDEPIHLSSGDCGRSDCPHGCTFRGGRDSEEKTKLLEWAYRRFIYLLSPIQGTS